MATLRDMQCFLFIVLFGLVLTSYLSESAIECN